jgi:uncharacterized protein YecT (DUF1311 family)
MKTISAAAIVTLGLSCFAASVSVSAKSDDPCQDKQSNREARECYANEQLRVNAEADSLADKVAAAFREDSRDSSDPAASELRRKAASAVVQSQKIWKKYRDQYCSAVEFSWTTGSGAVTVHESCLFKLGRRRVQDLRSDFSAYLPDNAAHN